MNDEKVERAIYITFATIVLVGFGAGLFKVWNERQMTRAYDAQAAALERIATVAERAYPAPRPGPMVCRDFEGGTMCERSYAK